MESLPPKPVTEQYRAEIVRLPELTAGRRLFRWLLRGLARLLVRLLTRTQIGGLENVPPQGGLLAVFNHLGDADLVFGLALRSRPMEVFAKADFYDFPILGQVLGAYGVIWIHRGQPDRRAIRIGIEMLQSGRVVVIAPEARESVTGALEEGTSGAAYLALKAGVPVLPATLTGTANRGFFSQLKRFRRPEVTVTIGKPFYLESSGDLRADIERGTDRIMQTLAKQLPLQYRGVYKDDDGGAQ